MGQASLLQKCFCLHSVISAQKWVEGGAYKAPFFPESLLLHLHNKGEQEGVQILCSIIAYFFAYPNMSEEPSSLLFKAHKKCLMFPKQSKNVIIMR